MPVVRREVEHLPGLQHELLALGLREQREPRQVGRFDIDLTPPKSNATNGQPSFPFVARNGRMQAS